MSGHGIFLSDWMLSNESHIGSAATLLGYGILTVSDQNVGCCGRVQPEACAVVSVVREAQILRHQASFRTSRRTILAHEAPVAVKACAELLSVFRPAGPMWANG